MKKVIAVAGIGAAIAASLLGAGTANASPQQDTQYVACLAAYNLFNYGGPDAEAALGRHIAADILAGATPLAERNYVYRVTPTAIGVTEANVMVNCATTVWLGYGSEGPGYSSGSNVS